jgi:hypothetical protein
MTPIDVHYRSQNPTKTYGLALEFQKKKASACNGIVAMSKQKREGKFVDGAI